jgi:hypothetical protein
VWWSTGSAGLVESVESVESKKVYSSDGGLWDIQLLVLSVGVTLVCTGVGSDV